MRITTRALADLASAAAGRAVQVEFFDGRSSPSRADTIQLDRRILAGPGGDAVEAFLRGLGALLLRGQPVALAKNATEYLVADVALAAGRGWFGHAVRNDLFQSEFETILAAIQSAFADLQGLINGTATPTARAAARGTTPTAQKYLSWADDARRAGYAQMAGLLERSALGAGGFETAAVGGKALGAEIR